MRIGSTLLSLLLVLVLTAGSAYALTRSLGGDATLGMQSYRGESEGETQKATSLYQQYTAIFSQQDTLAGGRAGAYTLMAGYEINLLKPTAETNGVRDPEVDEIDTDKIYYNGNIMIAPGGLPFRLNIFAHDLRRSAFFTSDNFEGFSTGTQSGSNNSSTSGHLLAPNIFSDLSNGSHRTLGATLLLGIRNGSYLGAYRDVLSQLPRLLIDYKQLEVKDLHGASSDQTHYQDRDLAFVSLNKKDNWVHLRMRDHTDFINHENDNMVQQVMIGTIDHTLARKWINLTNWIKISGDLSHTVEDEVGVDPVRFYTLNMMFIGNRENLRSTILSQFGRTNDGVSITQSASVPMTATIDLNRNTRLRSRFIFESQEMSYLEGLEGINPDGSTVGDIDGIDSAWDFTTVYLDNQLELQRTLKVLFTPRLELEVRRQGESRESMALRIGTQIASNGRLNKDFSWLGGYELTATSTNDKEEDGSVSFLQNEIYGRVDRNFSRTLRVGARSSLTVGSGGGREDSGSYISTMSAGLSGANGTDTVDSDYSGMLAEGDFNIFVDHNTRTVGNRLDYDFAFFTADDVSTMRNLLRHSFRYSVPRHRFDWLSSLNVGENLGEPTAVSFDYLSRELNFNNNSVIWDTRLTYRYDPNRSTGLVLGSSIAGGNSISYKLWEEAFYHIFTSNGIVRRLIELTEEFGYEKVENSLDGRGSALYGRFSAAYFPTRNLYGKLSSDIVTYPDSGALQHIDAAEIGVDFQKMKFMATYSQGNKESESELLPEVDEKRWEVRVKKIF